LPVQQVDEFHCILHFTKESGSGTTKAFKTLESEEFFGETFFLFLIFVQRFFFVEKYRYILEKMNRLGRLSCEFSNKWSIQKVQQTKFLSYAQKSTMFSRSYALTFSDWDKNSKVQHLGKNAEDTGAFIITESSPGRQGLQVRTDLAI
jgi:hypothetical protein